MSLIAGKIEFVAVTEYSVIYGWVSQHSGGVEPVAKVGQASLDGGRTWVDWAAYYEHQLSKVVHSLTPDTNVLVRVKWTDSAVTPETVYSNTLAVRTLELQGHNPEYLFNTDFVEPLSGIVNIDADFNYGPEWSNRGTIAIDGDLLGVTAIDNVGFPGSRPSLFALDTTNLANGGHILHWTARTWNRNATNTGNLPAEWRDDGQLIFLTANGNTYRCPATRFQEYCLPQGETRAIEAYDLLCDGTVFERPARAYTYKSADTAVATVSDLGVLTAVAEGFTTVAVSRSGKTRTIRVRVRPEGQTLPHFARDGAILTAFDPDRSIIPCSMFGLTTKEILVRNTVEAGSGDALLALAADAGINCLEITYEAPSSETTLQQYINGRGVELATAIGLCEAHGFHAILLGDNWGIFPQLLTATLDSPLQPAVTDYVLETVRDSGIFIYHQVSDETTYFYSSSPPADIVSLTEFFDRTEDQTPYAFSIFSLSGSDAIAGWEDVHDFHLWHYFPTSAELAGKAFSHGQYADAVEARFVEGLAVTGGTKPIVLGNPSVSGPFYTKRVAGGEFTEGDLIRHWPVKPSAITIQLVSGLIFGVAGLRCYHFDTLSWHAQRLHLVGQHEGVGRQTGAAPMEFGLGLGRWTAMATVYRLVGELTPRLLQTPMSAVDVGPEFLAAARQSAASRLLILLNRSEIPATARVNLAWYKEGLTNPVVTRYRILGSERSQVTFRPPDKDVLVVAGGEALFYLLQSNQGRSRPTQFRSRAGRIGPDPYRSLAKPM